MLQLNYVFQQDLDIWDKSPGLPWTEIGYKTKGDIKRDPDTIRSVRRFWYIVKKGSTLKDPDSLAYALSHVKLVPAKLELYGGTQQP
jgi:hypothetical protein